MPILLMLAGAALGLGGLFVGRKQNAPKALPMTVPASSAMVAPAVGPAYPTVAPAAYSDPSPTGYPYAASTQYAPAPIAGTVIPAATPGAQSSHVINRGSSPGTPGRAVPPGPVVSGPIVTPFGSGPPPDPALVSPGNWQYQIQMSNAGLIAGDTYSQSDFAPGMYNPTQLSGLGFVQDANGNWSSPGYVY